MKELIINGQNVAEGRVVKTLEAMLNGATNEQLAEMGCRKWDSQFYHLYGEVTPCEFMVRKEFNCLTVWYTTAPTSFNGGDETVQRMYHPMCIISKGRDWEHCDIVRDFANGLIRLGLLHTDEYIDPKED